MIQRGGRWVREAARGAHRFKQRPVARGAVRGLGHLRSRDDGLEPIARARVRVHALPRRVIHAEEHARGHEPKVVRELLRPLPLLVARVLVLLRRRGLARRGAHKLDEHLPLARRLLVLPAHARDSVLEGGGVRH